MILKICLGKDDPEVDKDMDTDAPATPAHAPGGDPQIKKQMHDFRNICHLTFFQGFQTLSPESRKSPLLSMQ